LGIVAQPKEMARAKNRFLLPTDQFPFLMHITHVIWTRRTAMFGIGMPEMIIILVIALIVIGPHKLPELAKSLGKGLAEFKKATDDFQKNVQEEARKTEEKDAAPPQVATVATPHVDTPVQPPHAVPTEKKDTVQS
jgi:sec-independent protein translocase protein TatA